MSNQLVDSYPILIVTFLTGAVGKMTLVEDGSSGTDDVKISTNPWAVSPKP